MLKIIDAVPRTNSEGEEFFALIRTQLANLIKIVEKRNFEALKEFFDGLRENIELSVNKG